MKGSRGGHAPSCVTIGNFDGVHLGHQKLFQHVITYAQEHQLQATCVTFEPLPQAFFTGAGVESRIFTAQYKKELIAAQGLAQICVQPFEESFSQLTPEAFVKDFLVGFLNVKAVFVGENFCFGKGRVAGVTQLVQLAAEEGIYAHSVPLEHDVDGIKISSTRVRQCLRLGDVETAAVLLGRPYRYFSPVIHGMQIGREIGFPTLNLQPNLQMLPKEGVYAGWVELDHRPGRTYPAAICVGSRPTFVEDGAVAVEAYLLEGASEPGSLPSYGDCVALVWGCFLRDNRRFASPAALVEQIKKDVHRAKIWLAQANVPTSV